MLDTLIPIAETFTSVQGEGAHAGIRMFFIRLAGCTVGRRFAKEHYAAGVGPTAPVDAPTNPFIQYPTYVNECSTFDGVGHFPCDTDYRLKEKVDIQDLVGRIPEGIDWISVTGGEPLMHGVLLDNLVVELVAQGWNVHIETSGTIIPSDFLFEQQGVGAVYIACSPKAKYIPEVVAKVDEIRLMVDDKFDVAEALKVIAHVQGQVYLCPLSLEDDVTKISRRSMAKCLELIAMPEFAHARISLQLHKIMGLR
jgi:organic radical activating enzyme